MVQVINCECAERIGSEINTFKLFEEIRDFFQEQVNKGVYEDLSNYNLIWHKYGGLEKDIYRTTIKQYKCKICGCLWEFCYPEFPASGKVRKFPDGIYHEKG